MRVFVAVVAATAIAATTIAAIGLLTVFMRRRGYTTMGGDVIVRCREGHLFTTIWIPGASVKAVRLGVWRFQRCPIDRRWTFVRAVKDADLSDEDRRVAAEHHDVRVP